MSLELSPLRVGRIVCRTEDGSLRRWIEGATAWNSDLAPSRGAALSTDWETCPGSPPWNGSTAASCEVLEGIRGFLHRGGPVFVAARHAAAPQSDVSRAAVWVRRPDRVLVFGRPDPQVADWAALRIATLYELFGAAGQVALHTSAVGLEAGGVLLVGPSGAGKSTLAYLATVAGAHFLADDVVLVSANGHGWQAESTERRIRLDPALRLDSAMTVEQIPDARGKVSLSPPARGGFPPGPMRVQVVVALRGRHPEATRWSPISESEAMVALIGQAGLALSPEIATSQLLALSRLARLPAVALEAGVDLLRSPERVLETLGRICAQCRERSR